MRSTRWLLAAALLIAVAGRSARAQEGDEDPEAAADSAAAAAAAACAAVDSAVVDSAVRDAIDGIRGTRSIRPKLIIVNRSPVPAYQSLQGVQWQTVELSESARFEVGALLTDPATRVRQFLLRLRPGTSLPAHWHGAHETLLVMQGAITIRDSADRVIRLAEGSYTFQPAAAPHSLSTDPSQGALLFVTSEGSWDIHLDEPGTGAANPDDGPERRGRAVGARNNRGPR